MIIDDKYKVSWRHYNKDNDITELTKDELREEIFKAMESTSKAGAIVKIDRLLAPAIRYNKSFSECTVESLYTVDSKSSWVIFSKGIAIVNPNDNFNRKKGVLISFDDAVSNIEDRSIRTLLWNTFWKIREPKREHIKLVTDRDRHLRVFLEETSNKRIQGKHIIYTIPENTEIWFPRND